VGTRCSLCRDTLDAPVLMETALWRVALNRNQDLLGKTIIVLRRHLEDASRLSRPEWGELRDHVFVATTSLRRAFLPDHFNYAFLQNADRHVHMHVVPRYAAPRELGGELFVDTGYPGHYTVPTPQRFVSTDILDAITRALEPP
jgi:diadenosine tetraphosphate (Ap4A) HIT family hydrolase